LEITTTKSKKDKIILIAKITKKNHEILVELNIAELICHSHAASSKPQLF